LPIAHRQRAHVGIRRERREVRAERCGIAKPAAGHPLPDQLVGVVRIDAARGERERLPVRDREQRFGVRVDERTQLDDGSGQRHGGRLGGKLVAKREHVRGQRHAPVVARFRARTYRAELLPGCAAAA